MKQLFITTIILNLLSVCALAQTTEFTYQGRLNDNALPASGTYEMRFRLFDAESAGTQQPQPGPITIEYTVANGNAVTVANGVFSVALDFTDEGFPGAARFLEISVRRSAGDAFALLTPRQPVRSAPHSIKTLRSIFSTTSTNSFQLGGINADQYVTTGDPRLFDARDPLPNSTNYIQNRGTPQSGASFNIGGSGNIGGALRIEGAGFIVPTPILSLSSNGIFQIDAPFTPSGRFVVLENGNVGIGNAAPNEKLQVAGNVLATGTLTAAQYNIGGSRVLSIAGTNNLFAGVNAGAANTGNNNSFVGVNAGFNNTTGGSNSFFGGSAGAINTTGFFNSFFGVSAGFSNTTGFSNSFVGLNAGYDNTTGHSNSFVGVSAGASNTDGSDNSFFGASAGFANTTGISNSFVGSRAGLNNTEGRFNLFVGASAGVANTTGEDNSFVGVGGGRNTTTGDRNSFFGREAGENNTTGSNNTIIGSFADVGANNLTRATALGAGAVVNNSNSVVLGTGADTVRIPGNLIVTGSVSKGSGSFKIDHPLDPQNKYLSHSFVESPDMMNVYNGNVMTDGQGEATVMLPDYFEALNRDFRYQLTVIGQFAHAIVGEKIKDNQFKIRTDKPNVEVSWQVTGIRKDRFAEDQRILVEETKPDADKGRCLYAPLCSGATVNGPPR